MIDFVRWAVQGRVLLIQFSGISTLEDIVQMNTQALILMKDGLPPHVDVIVDGTYVTKFDAKLANIRSLRALLIIHPLVNWIIIVDPKPNPVMKFVAGTAFSLMGIRYRLMTTVPEALAFLQSGSHYDLTRTDLVE